VTRDQYGAWLSQMFHVHAALEAAVAGVAESEPRVRVVDRPTAHSQNIRNDLAALGLAVAAPLPAVEALVPRISSAGIWALVGMQYVLEGSMNGNKYIAMGVRRGLGLTPGAGDTYLDPYGDGQRPVWAAYRAALDGLELVGTDQDEAVRGAQTMF